MPTPIIDIAAHMDWAEAIARQVARRGGVRGSSVDDLVAVAYQSLCELAQRYDPARCPAHGDHQQLFRGWSRRAIVTLCIDEVRRDRSGGLIRKRVRKPFVCEILGELSHSLSDDAGEPEIIPLLSQIEPGGISREEARQLQQINRRLQKRSEVRRNRRARTAVSA